MIKWYGDDKGGGFFYTASDGEKLFARAKDFHDGVQPSGNSVRPTTWCASWQKTGDDEYRKLAEKTIKQFAGGAQAEPGRRPGPGRVPARVPGRRRQAGRPRRPTRSRRRSGRRSPRRTWSRRRPRSARRTRTASGR